MTEKWINNLRRQLDGYERKAPEGLLDDIKKEMSRRGVMPTGKQKPSAGKNVVKLSAWRGTGNGRIWKTGVAAAVVAAFVVVYQGLRRDVPVTNPITGETAKVHNIAPSGSRSEVGGVPAAGHESDNALANLASNVREYVLNVVGGHANGNETLVAMNSDAGNVASQAPVAVGTDVGEESHADTYSERPKHIVQPSRRNIETANGKFVLGSNGGRRNGWAASVGYSGMGSMSTSSGFGGLREMAASDPVYNSYTGDAPKAVSEMTTDAHHDMPIKFGLSLRYNVDDRWSVQTGVNYSYLSSDIKQYNNIEESNSRQRLHYVSIPVAVNYGVWRNSKASIYLSAGAEVSKLVKGSADIDRVTYGQSETKATESVSEHRLQYSVGAAIGAEYKIGSNVSVYAEPGFTHYFDNHSAVNNIYKDKPSQFTINVGLRFGLGKKQ